MFNVRPFNTKDVKKRTSLKPSPQSRTSAKQCLALPIAPTYCAWRALQAKSSSRHADISKSRSAERTRHVTRSRCQCEWALRHISTAKSESRKTSFNAYALLGPAQTRLNRKQCCGDNSLVVNLLLTEVVLDFLDFKLSILVKRI